MSALKIKVRYAREATDGGVPYREEYLQHRELEWAIPPAEAAIVLVDCWNDYFLESWLERVREIVREQILPTVQACRRAGMAVIHAPGGDCALNYPQVQLYGGDPREDAPIDTETWPPDAFRKRSGPHACFDAPNLSKEPVYVEWLKKNPVQTHRIAECLGPEKGDYVVATAGQLHRLCQDRKILHLFYAGFATNICIQFRTYGMRPMKNRGYNTILIRDCTTGIELPQTLKELQLTQAAILDIEMKVGVSTTGRALQEACHRAMVHGAPNSLPIP